MISSLATNITNRIRRTIYLLYFSRGRYFMGRHFMGRHVPEQNGIFYISGARVTLSGNHYLSMLEEIVFADSYQIRNINDKIETVVDIGANIGVFTLFIGQRFNQAVIYAYEPNKSIINHTLSNLTTINNFKLYSTAVTNISGLATIYIDSNHTASSLLEGITSSSEAVSCETISFSSVMKNCGGKIDLLKLDCEGSEYQIFSCSEIEDVKYIVGELHTTDIFCPQDGVDMLTSKGFKVQYYPFWDSKAGIFFAKKQTL